MSGPGRGSAVPGHVPRPTIGLLVGLAAVVVLLATGSSAQAAPGEPELREPSDALDEALSCPERFEATDREPVLLVHGTGPVARENFGWNLLPQLRADGFDVCTVDLPTRALADIQVASEYVVYAVRTIHAATGRPVDVAGHSQGGLEPRWAMAWWPSTRDQIDDLVTFASPHDGTLAADAACAGTMCWPAVHQMRPGSQFLAALWAQEDLGAVDVTSLGSRMDELVQPPETIELPGAANIHLQDVCPARPVTHISIVADAVAYALTVDAFTSPGPADVSRLPEDICLETFIDEASPEHLLDPDALGEYLDGSFVDPEIPRSLLTSEEPEIADYAKAAQQPEPDERPDGDERSDDAEPPRDGEQPEDGDPRADGEQPDEPAPDAIDAPDDEPAAEVLPVTGGGATLLAAAALASALALKGAVGIGRPARRR